MADQSYKFPTLDEIKNQCRIDNDDEDNLLNIYLKAAISRAQNYTNRIFYEDKIPEDANSSAMLVEPDVKIAILLAVGYWYQQREDVTSEQLYSVPLGFNALLNSYRYIPI
ncbi:MULTISPECIES: head-tail connector protein [unclassified Gilliamella]|uniref:head-tail connector protein n=1 Tax=unclassified Gilliamella TaxID=2685620 RepID=UPI00226A29BA|nr:MULTISPECIES: head-tail connector protein [unclassified Gilliamella]MCX8641677.1 phage gp6-like head-tail connector protein [Gilliamella sp. B3835]MCX8706478.1 phage gp6-like head-tail connector protein [Gilliamella sp. B3783]MCX8709179.1 phage gp6-like head-tail connector protein [Gilliamella sp. B3780]MCX8714551.1 phage gp6-like head-tail connector protein [Gilliamella sp. B3781]MCX8715918.1 phage gp6-like head-tail connector protein [Gilliamella sp. B3784]